MLFQLVVYNEFVELVLILTYVLTEMQVKKKKEKVKLGLSRFMLSDFTGVSM